MTHEPVTGTCNSKPSKESKKIQPKGFQLCSTSPEVKDELYRDLIRLPRNVHSVDVVVVVNFNVNEGRLPERRAHRRPIPCLILSNGQRRLSNLDLFRPQTVSGEHKLLPQKTTLPQTVPSFLFTGMDSN